VFHVVHRPLKTEDIWQDLDWVVGNVTFSLVKAERTPKAGFNNDAGDVLGGGPLASYCVFLGFFLTGCVWLRTVTLQLADLRGDGW